MNKKTNIFLMAIPLLIFSLGSSISRGNRVAFLSGNEFASSTVDYALTSNRERKISPHVALSPVVSVSLEPTGDSPDGDEIIINDLPGKYLITTNECRGEDGYYIPENGYSPLTNDEVLNQIGMREGRKYIIETGRKNGWRVEFLNSGGLGRPRHIIAVSEMYKSSIGAQKALENYYQSSVSEYNWQPFQELYQASNNQVALIRKINTDTPQEYWYLNTGFVYYNYMMTFYIEGRSEELDIDFINGLLYKTLIRLKEEPLHPLHQSPTKTLEPNAMRSLDLDLTDVVLVESDLPGDANYRSSVYYDQTIDNAEIIIDWGIEIGREYVIETGREYNQQTRFYSYDYRNRFTSQGYRTYDDYLNGLNPIDLYSRDRIYPDIISCQVVKYDTFNGAQKAMSYVRQMNKSVQDGWKLMPMYGDLGELSELHNKWAVLNNGEIYQYYSQILVQNNYLIDITVYGYDNSVNPEFVVSLSSIVLDRITGKQ